MSNSTPSPPLQQPTSTNPSSPQTPQNAWIQRQLQNAFQQYVAQAAASSAAQAVNLQQQLQQLPLLQQQQPQPIQALSALLQSNLQQQQQPIAQQQPVAQQQQQQPLPQSILSQLFSPQQQALLAHFQRQQQAQALSRTLDNHQMLSLLMDEKPSTLLGVDTNTLGSHIDGQQVLSNFTTSLGNTPFKNATPKHSQMQHLPQAKNSTPLFPAPIAVFDKQRFQLLDANEAMANFVGHNTVASLSTEVVTMDDLVNPEAAHIAKNAYSNFITTPTPCFRMGEVRTRGGHNKTVEFHVDLTEQLLIFTIKSVFDTCPGGLPEATHAFFKKGITSQQCNCKACEFLSPID